MAAPSRIELKKITATPAPSRIHQGLFFHKSLKSCFSDVFSFMGLIRSLVHEKQMKKNKMAIKANTMADNCQPCWGLFPPPILEKALTTGSANARTKKLPP